MVRTALTLTFNWQWLMRALVLAWLSLLVCVSAPQAATVTAASCENKSGQTDVQNAINAASNGDTVVIPAGTCAWTVGLAFPNPGKAIKVTGSGTIPSIGAATSGGTTIQLIAPQFAGKYDVIELYESTVGYLEISNLTIINNFNNISHVAGQPTNGVIFIGYVSGGKPVILHHLTLQFTNFQAGDCGGSWMVNAATYHGVVYRNKFLNDNPGAACGFSNAITTLHLDPGAGTLGPGLWSSTSTLGIRDTAGPVGVGGEGNFYFETNQVDYGVVNGIDINDGARIVIRYNTFNNTSIGGHGHDSSPVSNRQWEIYNNTFTWDGAATMNRWIAWRGGSGIIMDNITPHLTGFVFTQLCTFALDRNVSGCPNLGNGYPWYQQCGWGYDGSHLLDANGRDQQISPIYNIGNYEQPNQTGNVGVILLCGDNTDAGSWCGPGRPSQATFLASNRDYYNFYPNFDGSAGTGRGLRAARPATCTKGVAYASTDSPGMMDLCTATNTWTNAWYTEYQYPHPLAPGGSATSSAPAPSPAPAPASPAAPSNLQVK